MLFVELLDISNFLSCNFVSNSLISGRTYDEITVVFNGVCLAKGLKSQEDAVKAVLLQMSCLYNFNCSYETMIDGKPFPKGTIAYFDFFLTQFMDMPPRYASSTSGHIRKKQRVELKTNDVKKLSDEIFS